MNKTRESRKGNLHVKSLFTQWTYLHNQMPESGAILLVRLGDYYESFYTDCEIVSGACNQPVIDRGEFIICGFPIADLETVKANLKACKIRVFITENRVDLIEP